MVDGASTGGTLDEIRILFNHESPRRGETFVTRKITRGLANIAQGLEDASYRAFGDYPEFCALTW